MVIKKNECLKKHNTYGLNSVAEHFVCVKNKAELTKALRSSIYPKMILGGGSNVLITGSRINGLVIKVESDGGGIKKRGDKIIAFAGVSLPMLSAYCESNGIGGFSWASGIPGTVGGAIKMNAGCFRQNISDNLSGYRIFDKDRSIKHIKNNKGFGYRKSPLKQTEVVLETEFRAFPACKEKLKKEREFYLSHRERTQPKGSSCGSVFKKVICPKTGDWIAAGRLIDEAGLKGLRYGGAVVSAKHANFIINDNNATANDILNLIDKIKKIVYDRFGVELETEVEILS